MTERIRLRWVSLLAALAVGLGACTLTVDESATLPTATPSPSATLTPSASPTATASPTPTQTPSITPTPTITLTPTITPTPTDPPPSTPTPFAPSITRIDQLASVDIPADLRDGLETSWYAFLSVNERTDTTNLETPIAPSDTETLYLIDPATGQQQELLHLPASTDTRIYWAPDGQKVLYFLEPGIAPDGTRMGGLYLLNLELAFTLRIFEIPALTPPALLTAAGAGIDGPEALLPLAASSGGEHAPVWAPDSSQFAITLQDHYDTDIFLVPSHGSEVRNITDDGAMDMWPAWSPDGRRLAFVSGRAECPSWVPGEADSCAEIGRAPRSGGNLYVLELQSGQVRQIGESVLTSPPTWVSNLQIAFTTQGDDSNMSRLWVTNIQSGTTRQVSADDDGLILAPAWAPGGARVLYQRANASSGLIIRDGSGALVAETDRYTYARYGFAAEWSPSGDLVALAGQNGLCPYGLIVARSDLTVVTGPLQNARACSPSYSPDGRWLAYAGIQQRVGYDDGRLDLYVAQPNGYGATNLTGSLRGEIRVLGWVGPSQPDEE